MAVVTKEGELQKYRNMLTGWSRRYCKLDRNYFHYFASKFDASPVSSAVRGDIITAAPATTGWVNTPFTFEVTQKDGTVWYFRAQNQADMDSWLAALNSGPTRKSVKHALDTREAQMYGSCSEHYTSPNEERVEPVSHPQPSKVAHVPPPQPQATHAVQHVNPPAYNPSWPTEGASEASPVHPHAGAAHHQASANIPNQSGYPQQHPHAVPQPYPVQHQGQQYPGQQFGQYAGPQPGQPPQGRVPVPYAGHPGQYQGQQAPVSSGAPANMESLPPSYQQATHAPLVPKQY